MEYLIVGQAPSKNIHGRTKAHYVYSVWGRSKYCQRQWQRQ